MSRIALLVVWGALVTACHSVDRRALDGAAPDCTTGLDWRSLVDSPPWSHAQRSEQVRLSGSDGNTRFVRYDTMISPQGLTMVATTLHGIPVYTLSVAAGQLTATRYVPDVAALPLELTLSDFVLAHWPAEWLAAAAQRCGSAFEQHGQASTLRQLDGTLLTRVDRPAGEPEITEITHVPSGWQVSIVLLLHEELSP